jgi:simple sugar transport system ATP-binding protein
MALAGVDVAFARGEVHAVVGENGAGKTTLMRILAGVQQPDAGSIRVGGRAVGIGDVEAAYRLGIAMVHQHFMLFPSLTVAENLTLGREPQHRGLFDAAAAERAVVELGERYALRVDPRKRIDELSVGDLQRVEILRALYREAELLILDEPTAVLTPQEADGLFRVIDELRGAGKATIFISHKLDEVMRSAERVTVLRDGQVTGSRAIGETSAAELARLMVGRELAAPPTRVRLEPGAALLRLEGVTGPGVRGIDLDVHAHEIVGVAGVAGNGQAELAELICGLIAATAGTVTLDGRDVTTATVLERRDAGLAYVPDDRFKRGLAADASVEDNLIMGAHRRPPLARRGRLDGGAASRLGAERLRRFAVKAGGLDDPARSLSGGNAQRLVIARELGADHPVIVVVQPTRGIDIAATRFVHDELLARRAAGAAILLISADLAEILALSDRVVVLFAGRIAGEMPVADAEPERLGLLMAGVTTPSTASATRLDG